MIVRIEKDARPPAISGGVLTGVTVFDKRKRHSVK